MTLDTVLLGLRERVETDGLGAAAAARLQNVMRMREQALPMLHRLVVLDADGRIAVTSADTAGPQAGRFAQLVFSRHRDSTNRQMLLGWPVRDPVDGAWTVTTSRRLTAKNGDFAGVVWRPSP